MGHISQLLQSSVFKFNQVFKTTLSSWTQFLESSFFGPVVRTSELAWLNVHNWHHNRDVFRMQWVISSLIHDSSFHVRFLIYPRFSNHYSIHSFIYHHPFEDVFNCSSVFLCTTSFVRHQVPFSATPISSLLNS